MKRLAALLLALALSLSLIPNTLAAEAVTPTPPEWINAEDYLTFPGDDIYLPENWASIETMREKARNGAKLSLYIVQNDPYCTPGTCYEHALLRFKYAENVGLGTAEAEEAFYGAAHAFEYARRNHWKANGKVYDELYHRMELERLRASALSNRWEDVDWPYDLNTVLADMNITLDDFFAGQYMYLIKPEVKAAILAQLDQITLILDGEKLNLDVPPEIKNQRTMVPVRAVGEAIGAEVEWVQDKGQVVMTRAGSTVTMTLNSTTADIDGRKVEMDVAPYAVNGRTLLPARYVAEFFGQKVDWDGAAKQALITEDKSVAGNSNLEAWALPMGAMLAQLNNRDVTCFGEGIRSERKVESGRFNLNGWNIKNREDLITTVLSMTLYGHDASFREMAADVKQRTPEERAAISAASDAWPDYMWEYTEYVDEKWGNKGIMAWDLLRMSNLVQWGYTAGYVTYEEALELLTPAAILLNENFSSWDEAYENYLDGYHWWARSNVLGKDVWQTERGKLYRKMKADPKLSPIFDDALFTTGVIPLPDKEG